MTKYYKDSPLLNVFALAAVGGDATKLNNDDDCSIAIEWLVENLHDPQYKGGWHRITEFATKTFGVFDKINAYVANQIISEDGSQMLLLFRDRLRKENFPNLLVYLENAAQSQWAGEEQSNQLKRLVELIRVQNPATEAAILCHMLLALQIKVGQSTVRKYLTREKVLRTLLPQASKFKPEDLSLDLLILLEEFGFIPHVNLESFFTTISNTNKLGESYERKTSWISNRPEQSDVSGIPYDERLRQWEQKKRQYIDRQIQLSQELDQLVQLTGARELEGSWKDEALLANIQTVQTLIKATLEHPITQDILQTEMSMPLGIFSYGLREELEQPTRERIKYRLEGMVLFLEFAKRNPDRYITLVKRIVWEFIHTATKLHGSKVIL